MAVDVCPWCGSYLIFLTKEMKWYCNSCHEVPRDKPFDKNILLTIQGSGFKIADQ